MPDDAVTKVETPTATEAVQQITEPVTQQAAPNDAAPKERDWNDPPQWAKDLTAKVDGLMAKEAAPKVDPNGNNSTTVKETVETDLPAKVVAPKKPHLITRLPKWL